MYCAKAICRKLGQECGNKVGLISDENYMVFQPMLPEVASGSISPRHVISPLRLLCRRAQVFDGVVEEIRARERTLVLNAGPFSGNLTVRYEHLVLALGAAVDLSRIPGMPEHSLLMRNVGDAMHVRATIIARLEEANLETRADIRKRLLSFVVVGGGYSGVETAGHILDLFRSVHKFYRNLKPQDLVVYLIHSHDHLLPTLSRRLGEYSARTLEKRGLRLILNQRVKAVTAERVHLENGTVIETNTVIATVGNAPHPLVSKLCQSEGFQSEKGQIITDENGRVKGQSHIWAAGDCAAFPFAQGGYCPGTAQFAMRQGKMIGKNIVATDRKEPLEVFSFKGLGEMASIGHRVAVADILGMNFSGFFAWWIWRTVYLAKLPRLDRKIRVVLDWTLDLFFPRDINHLSPRYTELLQEIYLEAGDVLFHRGEPAFSLYIVKDGTLEISDGKEGSRMIHEGDYFGEAALLDSGVWAHEARAVEATKLVAVPKEVFQQIVSGSGSLAKFFRKSAAKYKTHEAVKLLGRKMPPGFLERPVSDFMHQGVFSFSTDMKVEEALRVAREHPRSSHPVLDASGKILGIAEREDFYDFVKDPGTHADTTLKNLKLTALPLHLPATPAGEVMKNLTRAGSNKAIIVDDDQKPVGVVTILDLLAASCSDEVNGFDSSNAPASSLRRSQE